jgi:hypothetical protein
VRQQPPDLGDGLDALVLVGRDRHEIEQPTSRIR